jgi:hypothetical protein
MLRDGIRIERSLVTGPATACIEFGARLKQWGATTHALVLAVFPMVPILSSKRALSISLARDTVFDIA